MQQNFYIAKSRKTMHWKCDVLQYVIYLTPANEMIWVHMLSAIFYVIGFFIIIQNDSCCLLYRIM